MNIYKEYFQTLKEYLIILEIDKKTKGIVGCSDDDIKALIDKKGKLPLAYEEYLRSIGKFFLFDFMDAEDMSYEDIDYITEFGEQVFESNNFTANQPIIVISERRNDYISLIYPDEGDNPKVWIMSEYWDDDEKGENLTIRMSSFTDLMDVFFTQTLVNHTAGFHFVSSEIPENKVENHIRNLYLKWFKGLKTIKNRIDNYLGDNILINNLNEVFMSYYLRNENFMSEGFSDQKNKNIVSEEPNQEKEQSLRSKSFFQKIMNIFK